MGRSKWSRTAAVAMSGLVVMGMVACGDDDEDEPAAPATTAATTPRGSDVVTIDMIDHAYQVSGPLTAGGTLKIANKGTEFHMIGIGKLKPGKTLADLQTVLSEAGPPGQAGASTTVAGATTTAARGATTTTTRGATTTTSRGATTTAGGPTTTAAGEQGGEEQDPTADIIDDIGLPGSVMGPGESVELTLPNLQPGTYALVCFIPTEGEGPPHFAKGMVSQLEVVAGTAPAPPTADATYKLAPGRAIEGPATLTPGKHTLKFEAAAGSEQLEPAIARLNPGTTYQQLDTALTNLFEGEEPPAKGVARTVPGQVVFSGFDLLGTTNFFLTVDLKAGNYVVVAEDTDEERPGPPREILNLTVR